MCALSGAVEWPGAVCADGEARPGAKAVPVVCSSRYGSRDIEYLGFRPRRRRLETLKAARIPWPQRLAVLVLRVVAAQHNQLSRAAGRPSALSFVVRLAVLSALGRS